MKKNVMNFGQYMGSKKVNEQEEFNIESEDNSSDILHGRSEGSSEEHDKAILLVYVNEQSKKVRAVEITNAGWLNSSYSGDGLYDAVMGGDIIYAIDIDRVNKDGEGTIFMEPFSLESIKPIKVWNKENI
jgi:hypothetical protein